MQHKTATIPKTQARTLMRANNYNVLIFPGATEIALELHKSLSSCKEIKLYSASQLTSNHASYVFARHYDLPGIKEPNWLEQLNSFILEHRIDFIFPAHDDAIVEFAKNKDHIKAHVVSSPLETCLITRSKSKTYKLLENIVPVPILHPDPNSISNYPVFIKPDCGQGSQSSHLVENQNQLINWLNQREDYLISEYLPGEEYTVDCFTHRNQGVLYCAGRQRIRTRSGISMHSTFTPQHTDLFKQYANDISLKLELHGAWFFQLKQDSQGVFKLLEIAPRIAGTASLSRIRGINFPLLSIYEQLGLPLETLINPYEVEIDRALINRYKHSLTYKTVYIDLDDTLILKGQVNIELIQFIFQCINKKIKLILLTKHKDDINVTLSNHKLSGLFDQVIQIPKSANKSAYITDKNAIFIDDSFQERANISKLGILTFDCSMLELLVDWRS